LKVAVSVFNFHYYRITLANGLAGAFNSNDCVRPFTLDDSPVCDHAGFFVEDLNMVTNDALFDFYYTSKTASRTIVNTCTISSNREENKSEDPGRRVCNPLL
jgi:hypothetical protein